MKIELSVQHDPVLPPAPGCGPSLTVKADDELSHLHLQISSNRELIERIEVKIKKVLSEEIGK